MRKTFMTLLVAGFVTALAAAQTQPWVSAYYAGWMQDGYPPSAIDFGAMTHIIHFSLEPGNGGTLSGSGNGITPSASQAITSAAHAAGKKVIITVGGWGADGGFVNATSSANRATFVANLVNFMTTYGYDGIDIDWEPVTSPSQFKLFIPELRAAMTTAKPGSLLTIAVMGTDQAVIDMHSYFDQINLMTYDMSGAWEGWVTWHNSPIYDGGATFPSTGEPLPSANGDIDAYLAKGVPKARLGIGTDFYGYVWSGVSQPRESWTSAPSVQGNISYANLMSTYGSTPASWDASAGAAYISISSPSKKFISLDNEQTIAAKAEYVRTKGIGGVIIWEIGGGYRASAPAGSRDVLLQAVKQAFMSGTVPEPDGEAPVVSITSPPADAAASGTLSVQAQASDNIGVVGVKFTIDGADAGSEDMAAPYTASINTWSYANGPHTLSAVARDWAGNVATTSITINVNNQGTPPTVAPLVVYDDALKSPFRDASWSATVSYANTSPVMSGTRSVRVAFAAWGGFDILSGNWDAEVPIDPSVYDTLRFDIYPTASAPLTVGFYSSTVDIASPPVNQWTTISLPTPPDPFTRFYVANGTGSTLTAYFDNIRFTGQGTPAPVLLSAPTPVSPANGATLQPLTPALAWTSSTGATHYRLEVARDAGFTSIVSIDSTLTSTTRTVGPLHRKTWYFWRVRAGNARTFGDFSPVWKFRTLISIPKTPRTLSVTATIPAKDESRMLLWDSAEDAEAYRLQISLDSLFTGTVLDTVCSDTTLTLQSLSSGSVYYARVRAENEAGVSAYSPTVLFSLATSSVGNDQQVTSFTLLQNYPNPFNPATSIGYSVGEPGSRQQAIGNRAVKLAVYDLLGREVAVLVDGQMQPGKYTAIWDARGMASGVYICRLQAGDITRTLTMSLVR